jgi:hypothetical protein
VVEAESGRGGMGSVWRARRDDGQYDAVVAIKIIHAAWVGRPANKVRGWHRDIRNAIWGRLIR